MRNFFVATVAALVLAGCNTTTGIATPSIVSQADDPATRKMGQLILDAGIAMTMSEYCPQYAVRLDPESLVTNTINELLAAGYSLPQIEAAVKQANAAMASPAMFDVIEAYFVRQQAAAGPGADFCDIAANEVRQNTPVGQMLIRR